MIYVINEQIKQIKMKTHTHTQKRQQILEQIRCAFVCNHCEWYCRKMETFRLVDNEKRCNKCVYKHKRNNNINTNGVSEK